MQLNFGMSAPELARQLIGWELLYGPSSELRGGIISEVEAYTRDDPASHSFRGKTKRNAAMFMEPGTIYVYQIYGLHHCLNIVCGDRDGQAVLIRSLLPTAGVNYLRYNRPAVNDGSLCNGPAKLFQAMGISPALNGRHISNTLFQFLPPKATYSVKTGQRIGINKGVDRLWRYSLENRS